MTRLFFHLAWRLMLALSLAAAPWPPAAWAALAPAADVAGMSDCHDMDADSAPPSDQGTPCEDGCCTDPGCDPAHCLAMHASIVSPPRMPLVAPSAPATVPKWRGRACADPPSNPLLRPPIA